MITPSHLVLCATCLSAVMSLRLRRVRVVKIFIQPSSSDWTALGGYLSLVPVGTPRMAVARVLAVMLGIPAGGKSSSFRRTLRW